MQYLLTEDEYREFFLREEPKQTQAIQRTIVKMREALLASKKFRCIHGDDSKELHCDDCPVGGPKFGFDESRIACNLPKDYSQ